MKARFLKLFFTIIVKVEAPYENLRGGSEEYSIIGLSQA